MNRNSQNTSDIHAVLSAPAEVPDISSGMSLDFAALAIMSRSFLRSRRIFGKRPPEQTGNETGGMHRRHARLDAVCELCTRVA